MLSQPLVHRLAPRNVCRCASGREDATFVSGATGTAPRASASIYEQPVNNARAPLILLYIQASVDRPATVHLTQRVCSLLHLASKSSNRWSLLPTPTAPPSLWHSALALCRSTAATTLDRLPATHLCTPRCRAHPPPKWRSSPSPPSSRSRRQDVMATCCTMCSA